MPKSSPQRPTLRMVAAAAGVSIATVSYVLSGRTGGSSGVSPATAQRVREAAEALGYRPNQAARTVRTGRSNLILLSLTMLSDPWSQAVVDAVNSAIATTDLTAMILADQDWASVLDNQLADAVLIDDAETNRESTARLSELAQRHTLVVFSESLEPEGFDVVRSRAYPGCELAVAHLLDHHTKIGCLTSVYTPFHLKPSRYDAYVAGLDRAGIEYRPEYVSHFETTSAGAFRAAMQLLTLSDRPTAIYATTDFAAIGAIHAAQHLRLRVPEDIAVIGAGNTPDGELMEPALSTVGPTDFFNQLATIIRDRATGADSSPHRVHNFDWSLIVRDSSNLREPH